MLPMYTPSRAIETPGRRKIGVKRTGPKSLVAISVHISTTAENDQVRLPSIVEISWVHRVMIRDIGVSSSQLEQVMSV